MTAFPTKAGTNPLVKRRDGCDFEMPADMTPCKCVKMAFRKVLAKPDLPPVLTASEASFYDKFWIAISTGGPPLNDVRVDRSAFERPHPSLIPGVFPSEAVSLRVVETCRDHLDMVISAAREHLQSTPKADRSNMYDVLKNLQCMKRLVSFCPEEQPDEQKSTMWNPVGARVLINPSDIVSNGCTCARGARFDEHVSLDCKGAGVVTMTQFNNEEELLATILHATKVQLFSLLRVTPVSASDGIMRVNVDEDMPDTLRVTATLRNWTVSPGERGSSTSTSGAQRQHPGPIHWSQYHGSFQTQHQAPPRQCYGILRNITNNA